MSHGRNKSIGQGIFADIPGAASAAMSPGRSGGLPMGFGVGSPGMGGAGVEVEWGDVQAR